MQTIKVRPHVPKSFDIPATLVIEAIEGVQKTGEYKTDSYRMLNRQKIVQ